MHHDITPCNGGLAIDWVFEETLLGFEAYAPALYVSHDASVAAPNMIFYIRRRCNNWLLSSPVGLVSRLFIRSDYQEKRTVLAWRTRDTSLTFFALAKTNLMLDAQMKTQEAAIAPEYNSWGVYTGSL